MNEFNEKEYYEEVIEPLLLDAFEKCKEIGLPVIIGCCFSIDENDRSQVVIAHVPADVDIPDFKKCAEILRNQVLDTTEEDILPDPDSSQYKKPILGIIRGESSEEQDEVS